jgi:hypothetical protein
MRAYGMSREEDQVVREDRAPDYGCELNNVSIRVPVPSTRRKLTIHIPAWASGAVPA